MLPLIRKFRIILKAFGFAALALLVLLFVRRSQFTEQINTLLELNDRFFYKRFFKMRANHNALLKASNEILIIDSVDPKEEIGCDKYADLITKLAQKNVACIGVDIRFPGNREDSPEAKARLVGALQQFERIVLGVNFYGENPPANVSGSAQAREFLKQFALPPEIEEKFFNKILARDVELPFEALLFAAKRIGHINFERELYHIFPLIVYYDLKSYPAMPLEVVRLYHERRGRELDITKIPNYFHSQIFVNYVPRGQFEYKTLAQVESLLSDPVNLANFDVEGKIVLLVNSGPEVPFYDTPLGSAAYPRWALHASVISQLLQDRPIRMPMWVPLLSVAVILLLALIWNLFLAERFAERWLRVRWMLLIGNTFFVLLAYFGLQFEYWFGVVTPIIIYTTGLVAIRNDIYNIYQIPVYADFSISVQEFQGNGYPVSIVYSPAGEELDKVTFEKFFEKKSFMEIEEKLRRLSAGLHDTRELGKKLYEAIFQNSIDTRFMQSLGLISKDNKNLRIRLRLDAPEISRLPWEYLYSDALGDEFVTLNRNISLTRYIPLAVHREWTALRPPLRILVVISSPSDLPLLDIEAEKASIKECLRLLIWMRQVRLSFCEHATLEKLADAVSTGKHHVLHYIGHSDFDREKNEGVLLLENEDGTSQPIEATALGSILHQSSIRLTVMNSCKGAEAPITSPFYGVAQKLVKVGVPAVVAMQHLIRDDTAVLFTQTFYSTFMACYSIDAAVTETRRAIMRRAGINRQDWGTPVLFMRADGAKIFGMRSAG